MSDQDETDAPSLTKAHGLMLAECGSDSCRLGHILFLDEHSRPFAIADLNPDQMVQLMIVLGKRSFDLLDLKPVTVKPIGTMQ